MANLIEVPQYALQLDFNPSGSSPCTLNYLKHMRYKLPRDKHTKKDSTGKDGLETLCIRHPEDKVIPKILQARTLQKADGFFNDEHLGKDGRMHSEFTFYPSTGRLSSRKPNLNQIPQVRGDEAKIEVAKAIRSTVIATPGYTLVEPDWKAIEAVLVGYFAEDPEYIRAAKLGVHDILGSHILAKRFSLLLLEAEKRKMKWNDLGNVQKSLGMTDEELVNTFQAPHEGLYTPLEVCRNLSEVLETWREPILLTWDEARIKKQISKFKKGWPTLRGKSKIVVHGTAYGESVYAMSRLLRIPTWEAQLYFDVYCGLASKVMRWQEATRFRAHKEGYLSNPFGYVRYWFDVLRPKFDQWGKPIFQNGKMVMAPDGDEANEVLAFLPQSTGAGILRDALLTFDRYQCDDFHPLVPIHDAILFEIKDQYLDKYIQLIRDVMGAPIPQLGGLVVDVELKMGKSWDQVKEI